MTPQEMYEWYCSASTWSHDELDEFVIEVRLMPLGRVRDLANLIGLRGIKLREWVITAAQERYGAAIRTRLL